MSQLNAEELMAVYREGNLENGKIFFPDLKPDNQLLRAEDGFIAYLRDDFFQIPDSFYAVWAKEGEYCAALRMEPYKDGLLLEALETRPTMRRRGCAFNLIVSAISYAASLGVTKVYSHVNKRNKPSLQIHNKVGFKRVSESATYIDGTVTWSSCTLRFDIT